MSFCFDGLLRISRERTKRLKTIELLQMFHFIGKKMEAPGGWPRFAQVCSVCGRGAGPQKGRAGERWLQWEVGPVCGWLALFWAWPPRLDERTSKFTSGRDRDPREGSWAAGRGHGGVPLMAATRQRSKGGHAAWVYCWLWSRLPDFSHGGNVGCLHLRGTRPPVRSVFFP